MAINSYVACSGGSQLVSGSGLHAAQLGRRLEGRFGHEDVRQHVDGHVRAEQPALQGRRKRHRLRVEDETRRNQDDGPDEGIRPLAADPQETPTEPGNRIAEDAQEEKDLEEVLERYMADAEPPVGKSHGRHEKAGHEEKSSDLPPACCQGDKGQQVRADGDVEEQTLNGIFDCHTALIRGDL